MGLGRAMRGPGRPGLGALEGVEWRARPPGRRMLEGGLRPER